MSRRRNNPVRLGKEERESLKGMVASGEAPARAITRARILLKADDGDCEDARGGEWPDTRVAEALDVSRSTVRRVRERFAMEGLRAALAHRRPRNAKPKKLDGEQEAHLIALACSEPPEGAGRWSVRLLAQRFVELDCGEEVSRELVRRTLKKVGLSPG